MSQDEDFGSAFKRLRALVGQPDRIAVAESFALAEAAARHAWQLRALFQTLRLAFPRWQHLLVLLRLRAALETLNEKSEIAIVLRLNLRVAMRDFNGFLAQYYAALPIDELAEDSVWRPRYARLATVLGAAKFPNFAAPKVFGIGLSKTGTTSLNSAFERLGFLSSHYNNDFSGQMLEEEDAYIFDAMTDTPISVQFETLYHRFPNARFVYTTRPYDVWIQAFERHCQQLYNTTDFALIRKLPFTLRHHPYITDFEKVDCVLYFRHDDIHQAHAAYDARISDFFKNKPAGKLLRLEIGGGGEWSKLCEFLDIAGPQETFPWLNKSKEDVSSATLSSSGV